LLIDLCILRDNFFGLLPQIKPSQRSSQGDTQWMLSGWESTIDTIPSTSFCQPEANLLKELMTMGTLRLPCESIIHAIMPGAQWQNLSKHCLWKVL